VTCSEDNDPREKCTVVSKEYRLSADINIKIVLHPGAISTTCTYVWFLAFAYANMRFKNILIQSFYVTLCDEQAASSGCTMRVQYHQEAFVSF